MLKHLPNALTLSRLVLAAAFPWAPPAWHLPMVIIGLLTEFFDGVLSRALGAVTTFGKMLDPVADKVFVLAVALTMIVRDVLEPLELFWLATRDLTVLSGILWVAWKRDYRRLGEMPPRFLGKVATAFQFAFLILMVGLGDVPSWAFYPTVIACGLAAVDYIVWFTRPRAARAEAD